MVGLRKRNAHGRLTVLPHLFSWRFQLLAFSILALLIVWPITSLRYHLLPSRLPPPGVRFLQGHTTVLGTKLNAEDNFSEGTIRTESQLTVIQGFPPKVLVPKYKPYLQDFVVAVQIWVETKRKEPRIMHFLLTLVKKPIDSYRKQNGHAEANTDAVAGSDAVVPYKTCAVVGNSGTLLNQRYGSLIDSHEAVIRLNNARIAGFQAHVGSKTTISFVNSNILQRCARQSRCFCQPYGKAVPTVVYICQLMHLMEVSYCSALQDAPLIVTDPRFDGLCARIVKHYSLKLFLETTGKKPEEWSNAHGGAFFHHSSGMQAIMLALGICEKVDVFGFGKAPGMRHHYHTSQKAELELHDYEAEYQLYHDLEKNRSSVEGFFGETGFLLPLVRMHW